MAFVWAFLRATSKEPRSSEESRKVLWQYIDEGPGAMKTKTTKRICPFSEKCRTDTREGISTRQEGWERRL